MRQSPSQEELPQGDSVRPFPLARPLEDPTGISRFLLHVMELGMTLHVMLPDSAVTVWPLAHATQGQDQAFHRCLQLW